MKKKIKHSSCKEIASKKKKKKRNKNFMVSLLKVDYYYSFSHDGIIEIGNKLN